MHTRSRPLLLYFIFSFFIFVVFLFGLWHIVITEDLINKRLQSSFPSEEIKIKTEGLRKGFFYNLTIDKIILNINSMNSINSFTISNIKARFNFLSLFKLRPSIDVTAYVARGSLRGSFSIIDSLLNLTIEKAELDDLKFLNYGIVGKGIISGTALFYLKESKGEIKFRILDANIEDITDEVYIPLSLFRTVRGLVEFEKGGINIHSLYFEGKGIYGKIQDTGYRIQDSGFSEGSRMELMVNSDFSMPQLVEIGLFRYRRSPGYYIIPLRDFKRL